MATWQTGSIYTGIHSISLNYHTRETNKDKWAEQSLISIAKGFPNHRLSVSPCTHTFSVYVMFLDMWGHTPRGGWHKRVFVALKCSRITSIFQFRWGVERKELRDPLVPTTAQKTKCHGAVSFVNKWGGWPETSEVFIFYFGVGVLALEWLGKEDCWLLVPGCFVSAEVFY